MTTATATKRARTLGLVLTTALASATVAGCAGKPAPSAAMSAAQAQVALTKGKGDKAVALAEAAVLAAPRDGATRALLGAAYVAAGRFASATSALADAMELGETSARTVLTYALTLSAQSRYAEAQALLARHERSLDPADYGLAITLAGSPQQGVEVLSNALRYGDNTPKLRQNLAYAFALSGDWRSARLVAAQDVGADGLDRRLGEWAQMAMPQMAAQRVAALLGVAPRADSGQPAMLALANFPTTEQLAAEAAAQDAAPIATPVVAGEALARAQDELPAADGIGAPAMPALARTEIAIHPAPAPVAVLRTPAAPRISLPPPTPMRAVSTRVAPVAQQTVARPSPAFDGAFVRQPGGYRVQLGSYLSHGDAKAAWVRFRKRHPELKGAQGVLTKATVNGRLYYRVAAGGFAKASANSFCTLVKQGGDGCLAYSAMRGLPGTGSGAVARATATKTRVATR